jgi:hypothetical protein
MRCNQIVRVLDQFFLGERIDENRDPACADKGQREAADAFNQRMGALEKHADFKNLVDTAFVHFCSKLDFLTARVKHING